jgi:type 1 glutamine amidotransferase/mono/diheme cytochrome c family protein
MPQWYGCAVTCEPAGRLLRMTRVEWNNGVGTAHNAFPGSEFIRSRDAYFRPTWTESGPDGAFYFSDMYRGIIQEKTWFPTSLAEKHGDWRDEKLERWVARYQRVKKWGMPKVVRHGRIYRLLPDNLQKQPAPKMLDETPHQLVSHLAHPNGWWRDQAQKLIVSRGSTEAAPALIRMASQHDSPDARIVAMWTLQGIGVLEKSLLLTALDHPHPRVRRAAVQLSEPFLAKAEADIQRKLTELVSDPDAQVATQVFLAFRAAAALGKHAVPQEFLSGKIAPPLVPLILQQDREEQTKNLGESGKRGKQVYEMLCIACHGADGEGVRTPEKTLAPSLSKSTWFAGGGDIQALARITLKGLTGPINGQTYGEGVMMALESTHTDTQIADVLSYIGQRWHGWSTPANPIQIARERFDLANRKQPWNYDELLLWAKTRADCFHPIAFNSAATADGRQGVYLSKEVVLDRVSLKQHGRIRVHDVPFLLPNPGKIGDGKNVIVLKGGASANALSATMPESVELPVNQTGSRIHLLGAVAGWGWPAMKEKETVLTITVHYSNGSSEVIPLTNGIEIADHAGPVEVPGSAATSIVTKGQMRYLWRDLANPSQRIEKLTLASSNKKAAPLIAALTLESAASDGKLAPPPPMGGPVPSENKGASASKPLPTEPIPGKHRILLIGGGVSHDYTQLFNAHDRGIIQSALPVEVSYTSDPTTAVKQIPCADILVLSANDAAYSNLSEFREALVQFVQNGGGLVLLHPATWHNWRNWPAYNHDFVGGGAIKHEPHRDFQVHAVTPQHPVLQGVTNTFTIRDELYLVKLDSHCEVLAEAFSSVTGAKYPSVWVNPHPRARIISIALGHGKEAHEHADFAKLLGNAVKWAAQK